MSSKSSKTEIYGPLEEDEYQSLIENMLGAVLSTIRLLLWLTATLLGSGAAFLLWASFCRLELASHALVWLVAAIAVHGVRECGSDD